MRVYLSANLFGLSISLEDCEDFVDVMKNYDFLEAVLLQKRI